jgi:hypothetical protein
MAVYPGGGSEPYTVIELMEAWKLAMPAPMFIRDNLFKNVQTTSAKTVAVDYWHDLQRLAPWVAPISMGRVVNREKFRTYQWSPPKLAPVRTLHPEDLWDKIPGEAFGGPDVNARDGALLAMDMDGLDSLIARREELMACQCITTGKVTCYTIEGDRRLPLAELDFEIQPPVVVSPFWNLPNSDPLTDLKTGMRALSAMAGSQCDFIVMGGRASDAFETNPLVVEGYNKYWIRPGELNPKEIEWGVTVLGSHRGITLYSYASGYEDHLTGNFLPYIPDNLVILAARGQGSGTMAYAGVAMEADGGGRLGVFEGSRVWKTYFDQEVRHLRCISKPAPIPPNSRTWMVLQVLP